jgi:hypothetical protein
MVSRLDIYMRHALHSVILVSLCQFRCETVWPVLRWDDIKRYPFFAGYVSRRWILNTKAIIAHKTSKFAILSPLEMTVADYIVVVIIQKQLYAINANKHAMLVPWFHKYTPANHIHTYKREKMFTFTSYWSEIDIIHFLLFKVY